MKRAGLSALLREHGFAGGASTFRKLVGKTTVFVVNVQRSTSGGSYINLGVHLKHLGKSHWPDVEEHQCAFRTRLQDFAGGERFFFDDESRQRAVFVNHDWEHGERYQPAGTMNDVSVALSGMTFFVKLKGLPGAPPKMIIENR